MDKIINLVVNNHLGDLASIIGVIITIIGFFVTIFNVLRSKSAATQAEQTALKIREDIKRIDIVAEISAAKGAIDEIKRLQRQEAWNILPDRYSALRTLLISIKSSNPDLPDKYKRALQNAIQHSKGIEEQIDGKIDESLKPSDTARLNAIISSQADALQEILAEIKNKIGR